MVKQLMTERHANGPYRSLSDFLIRVHPDVAQTKLLIKAGCLDSIAGDLTRPALLWRLLASQASISPSCVPVPEAYSFQKSLAHELTLFGFPLQCHPLDVLREAYKDSHRIVAKDLPSHIGKDVTLIGWLLTEKIVSTKKGDPMEFMTLEDQTAMYDATVFPQTYRQYCHLLATNQAYMITGLVEEQFSTITVTVRTLRLLSTAEIQEPSDALEALSA